MTKSNLNKTIELTPQDRKTLRSRITSYSKKTFSLGSASQIIHGDAFQVLDCLPEKSVDLVFADPPYNMDKKFGKTFFNARDLEGYESWTEQWVKKVRRVLKPTASIYVCSEWSSSSAVHRVLEKYFHVRNRITWEREKGRGARSNWKNSSEDIWFCTVGNSYTFNVGKVMLRKKIIAPYTDQEGKPKDWEQTDSGKFRETAPSNLWTDLTVPFWSMAENTPHPTQKPEKLLAKIILASSDKDNLVLDPFLGSGTTAAVCKKLNRRFWGIESEHDYCLIAAKRIEQVKDDNQIQGYADGVFWERNSQVKANKIKAIEPNRKYPKI